MKYKWKVQPEPTGRYRSFEKRGWPEAITPDDYMVALISCDDDYSARVVKSGNHGPLSIWVPVKQEGGGYRNRKLRGSWATLAEAKEAFARFVETFPDHDYGIKTKDNGTP